MSALLSPALLAFVQIALALIAGYVCFVLVKIVRDAIKHVDTLTTRHVRRDDAQSAARAAAPSGDRRISTTTRQQP